MPFSCLAGNMVEGRGLLEIINEPMSREELGVLNLNLYEILQYITNYMSGNKSREVGYKNSETLIS